MKNTKMKSKLRLSRIAVADLNNVTGGGGNLNNSGRPSCGEDPPSKVWTNCPECFPPTRDCSGEEVCSDALIADLRNDES